MHRHPPLARRAAFTLIELLVSIAIIALLIGILLPVLGGVRGRARTAQCLAQSRQIVTAIAAFSASNRGLLPENRPLVRPGEHETWRARFAADGYIPEGKAWLCPALPGEPRSELGANDNGTVCVGDVPATYAINGHLLWRSEKRRAEADRPDAAVDRPSHTVLLAESRAQYPDIRVTDFIVATDDQGGGFFGYWHAGDGTYGFLDGHAETINFLDTGNPDCRWHNGRDLTADAFDVQQPDELGPHAHEDWQYLASEVYFRTSKSTSPPAD